MAGEKVTTEGPQVGSARHVVPDADRVASPFSTDDTGRAPGQLAGGLTGGPPLSTSARADAMRSAQANLGTARVNQVVNPSSGGARWIGPLDYGTATDKPSARAVVLKIRHGAFVLKNAGFTEFDPFIEQADGWLPQLVGDGPLNVLYAGVLRGFGDEYQKEHEVAVGQVAKAILGQLSPWRDYTPSITEQDLFNLREAVHERFVEQETSDALKESVELVERSEAFVAKYRKLTGYAAKASLVFENAKRLEDITEGLKEIEDKLGEVKEYLELAHNIARMVGKLGGTPAGADPIGSVEAGLDVIDFVITKSGVPGLTQLWSGYIYKGAKLCLTALRAYVAQERRNERGGSGDIARFFGEHRTAAVAPRIDVGRLIVRINNIESHFPGGQDVFDFMWQLMRGEAKFVPPAVEDYFVRFREEVSAGIEEEMETEEHGLPFFGRREAPFLLNWLEAHKHEVWVKLYGGMPEPVGGRR